MGCDRVLLILLLPRFCFNPRTRMGCDVMIGAAEEMIEGFNPRTRMGCDSQPESPKLPSYCFNPRTRMGCDVAIRGQLPQVVFQSTHPHGVRPSSAGAISTDWIVSIHAPAWGATVGGRNLTSHRRFNPRTRMGCDSYVTAAKEELKVSIHAPAWGATSNQSGGIRKISVSIHAPAWGATCRRG